MNKVLIVSDSHGWTVELDELKKRHQTAAKIHCGDSELASCAPHMNGFVKVKGNCDWKADFPLDEVVEIGGLTFFVTHGHRYDVKRSLLHLQDRAKELHADVVCFGHSHIAYAEEIDGQLFINPGSIRQPRRFKEPSYAVLEWDDASRIQVVFYRNDGQAITSFPYEKQFNIKNSNLC